MVRSESIFQVDQIKSITVKLPQINNPIHHFSDNYP